MTDKELLELKNQIREINYMYREMHTSLTNLVDELKELYQNLSDFYLPKLDLNSIDLSGDLK